MACTYMVTTDTHIISEDHLYETLHITIEICKPDPQLNTCPHLSPVVERCSSGRSRKPWPLAMCAIATNKKEFLGIISCKMEQNPYYHIQDI